MKNLKYILIAVIVMFIGIGGVSAANIEKTCLYVSENLHASLTINDDGTASGMVAKYNDKLSLPYVFVSNWTEKKSIYDSSKKCPNFVIVNYNDKIMNVSDDENELKRMISANNALIGTGTEYDPEYGKEIVEELVSGDLERTCLYESDDKKTLAEIQFIEYPILGLDMVSSVAYFNDRSVGAYTQLFTVTANSHAGVLDEYKNNPKCYSYSVIQKNKSGKYILHVTNNSNEINSIVEQLRNDSTTDEIVVTSLKNDSKVPVIDDGDEDVIIPDYEQGCAIFGDTIVGIIKKIYGYFTWIIPVLIIILSMIDFVKVVGTGKDDDFKKAQNNLIKRVIIGVVFFLIPTLISIIINFSGITEQFGNGDSIWKAVTCILE